ncbi:hypothetical protein Esti_005427 [Eimeria stiedai]
MQKQALVEGPLVLLLLLLLVELLLGARKAHGFSLRGALRRRGPCGQYVNGAKRHALRGPLPGAPAFSGPPEAAAQGGANLCLALETSCDDTAAAVLSRQGDVLSNCVWGQGPLNAIFGGVNPLAAAACHKQRIPFVLEEALNQAGSDSLSISSFAFTEGPGLCLCLREAAAAAAAFAASLRDLLQLARLAGPPHGGPLHRGAPYETSAFESLIAAAYDAVVQELQPSQLRQQKASRGPYRGLLLGVPSGEAARISIDPSWHLRCALRRCLKNFLGGPSASLQEQQQQQQQQAQQQGHQQQQQRAAVLKAVWHRVASAKAPWIVGVNHLHGHALSAGLRGSRVFERGPTCDATAATAATAAATAKPVDLTEPFLCLLLSGGHSQISILCPLEVLCRGPLNKSWGGPLPDIRREKEAPPPISPNGGGAPSAAEGLPLRRRSSWGSQLHFLAQLSEGDEYDGWGPPSAFGPDGGPPRRGPQADGQAPLPFRLLTLGSTLDDSAGEALDKAARLLEAASVPAAAAAAQTQQQEQQQQQQQQQQEQEQQQEQQQQEQRLTGGALLEALAAEADGFQEAPPLGVFCSSARTLDMSFSGIKSGFKRKVDALRGPSGAPLSLEDRRALAASFQKGLWKHIRCRLSGALWLSQFLKGLHTLALVGASPMYLLAAAAAAVAAAAAAAAGVARNKQLQQEVLQELQHRRDVEQQQREFATLKKRLLRLVARRPLLLARDPFNGGPLDGGLQEGGICKGGPRGAPLDEQATREMLSTRVRGFKFQDYQAFSCSVAAFTLFCCSGGPPGGPLLVESDALAGKKAAAGTATAAGTAAAAAAEGSEASRCCTSFTLRVPGGPRGPLLNHQGGPQSVDEGGPLWEESGTARDAEKPSVLLLPAMWCYCGYCSSSSRRRKGVDRLVVPAAAFCTDNAAMIGWASLKYQEAHEAAAAHPATAAAATAAAATAAAAAATAAAPAATAAAPAAGAAAGSKQQHAHAQLTKALFSEAGGRPNPAWGAPSPSLPAIPFVKPKWPGGVALPDPLAAMDVLLLHALLQRAESSGLREEGGPQKAGN